MAFYELLIFGFIVLVISCVFLIRYYKAPSVTSDVVITVYLSWVLGFAGILLLPYDMSEALLGHTKSPDLSIAWHFIYWSTFSLAWGFLPIQMAYHTSGAFDFNAKIREAFWQNIIFYVVSAVAGIIYILVKVSVSAVSISEVVGFLMALGNTYGVLMIIVLMGNGLVSLPRRLWQIGNPETELTRLYMLAPTVESSYCDARFELEDCEEEVKRISQQNQGDKNIERMAQVIQDRVTSFAFAGRSTSLRHYRQNGQNAEKAKETESTKKGLVALHKRVIQAQLKVLACDRRWRIVISRARQLEYLAKGQISPEDSSWCQMQTAPTDEGVTVVSPSNCAGCLQMMDQIRLVWYLHIFKYVCRFSAVVCSFASAVILWSEIANPSKLKSPIGALLLAATSRDGISADSASFLAQTIIFLALCYMSVCTYWSLFRLNIGWAYTMQGPYLSPASSMLFNGTYFCRLQFYIGYNFIMFLNVQQMSNTSLLSDMMTNITLVPIFGSSFQDFAPILTAIIALFTLFNGYARILKLLGVDSEDAVQTTTFPCCRRTVSEADAEKIAEGKKLVSSSSHMAAPVGSTPGQTPSNSSRVTIDVLGAVKTAAAGGLSSKRTGTAATSWADDDSNGDSADSKTAIVSPLYASRSLDVESGRPHGLGSDRSRSVSGSSTDVISGTKAKEPVVPAMTAPLGKTYGGRYSRVDTDNADSAKLSPAAPAVNANKAAAAASNAAQDTIDLFSSISPASNSSGAASKNPGKVYAGRYS